MSEHRIQSAIARPYSGYFRHIHEKAAALVHGVVSNHGFVDGNKRTALYLLNLLVTRSGYKLEIENQEEFVVLIERVVVKEICMDALAEWFRERLFKEGE